MVGRAFYFDSPGTTRQIFKMKSLDSKVVFAANKYKISCCGIAVKDWFFVGIVKKFDVLIRVARIWEIDVGFVISTSSKIYFVASSGSTTCFCECPPRRIDVGGGSGGIVPTWGNVKNTLRLGVAYPYKCYKNGEEAFHWLLDLELRQ